MLLARVRELPIRLRLAAGYALSIVALVVSLELLLLTVMENSLLLSTDETLALRATQVEREIDSEDREQLALARHPARLLDLAPIDEFAAPGVYVQIVDSWGQTRAHSSNLAAGQLPFGEDAFAGALAGREVYATVPVHSERLRVLARPLVGSEAVVGVIVVGESLHVLDLTINRMRQFLVGGGLAALIGSLALGWWLTARAFDPIADLTRLARGIAATGQFGRRLEVAPTHDELEALAVTFNEMLSRLETIFRRQRDFVADASHELRGPLAVIRANLEFLTLEPQREDRQTSIREALDEARRMSRLVSDLLFLSEADANDRMARDRVPLDALVLATATRANEAISGTTILTVEVCEPALVEGDHDRLSQLLWNLAENAIRYTPDGGAVTMSLRRTGAWAELKVTDTGIGIDEEHLPHIFERFYRVDRARNRGRPGTGLGLAIVKQVVDSHRGQISVTSTVGVGTSFTVLLPLASG